MCGQSAGLVLLPLVCLIAFGCGLQAQPFPNGTVEAAGPIQVALTVDPNPPRAGQETTLTFELRRDGQPVSPADVSCDLMLDMPKMPMGLPAVPVNFTQPGKAQARFAFPMAGGWSAALKVTLRDGTSGTATFNFDVGP